MLKSLLLKHVWYANDHILLHDSYLPEVWERERAQEVVAILVLYVGVHVYADVDGDASQCAGKVVVLHSMYDPVRPETCCLAPDVTGLLGL
jgi:hypothetical protein